MRSTFWHAICRRLGRSGAHAPANGGSLRGAGRLKSGPLFFLIFFYLLFLFQLPLFAVAALMTYSKCVPGFVGWKHAAASHSISPQNRFQTLRHWSERTGPRAALPLLFKPFFVLFIYVIWEPVGHIRPQAALKWIVAIVGNFYNELHTFVCFKVRTPGQQHYTEAV